MIHSHVFFAIWTAGPPWRFRCTKPWLIRGFTRREATQPRCFGCRHVWHPRVQFKDLYHGLFLTKAVYVEVILLAFRCCFIAFRFYVCSRATARSHVLDFAFLLFEKVNKGALCKMYVFSNRCHCYILCSIGAVCSCNWKNLLQWWCWTVCHWHCHAQTATLANNDPYHAT